MHSQAGNISPDKSALERFVVGIFKKFLQIWNQHKKLHIVLTFYENRKKLKFPWQALIMIISSGRFLKISPPTNNWYEFIRWKNTDLCLLLAKAQTPYRLDWYGPTSEPNCKALQRAKRRNEVKGDIYFSTCPSTLHSLFGLVAKRRLPLVLY